MAAPIAAGPSAPARAASSIVVGSSTNGTGKSDGASVDDGSGDGCGSGTCLAVGPCEMCGASERCLDFNVGDSVEVYFGDQSCAVEKEGAAKGAVGVRGWWRGTVIDTCQQLVEQQHRKAGASGMRHRAVSELLLTVRFADGEVRRDVAPSSPYWRVRHAPPTNDDGCSGQVTPLQFRCLITHQPLDDPAKGASCTHLACFNYAALSQSVQAHKKCPHALCDARLSATRQIKRDAWLRRALRALPDATPVGATLYVRHGVAVHTRKPGPADAGAHDSAEEVVIDLGGESPVKHSQSQQQGEEVDLHIEDAQEPPRKVQRVPPLSLPLCGASAGSAAAARSGVTKQDAIECGLSDED